MAYTIAAVQYDSLKYMEHAKKKYEELEAVLNDPGFKISKIWLIQNEINTKASGFKVHLKAFEAVNTEPNDEKQKVIKEIENLAKLHDGVSELIRSGDIANAKTIRHLTELGLYTPQ